MRMTRTIGAIVAVSGLSGSAAITGTAAAAGTQQPTLEGRAVLPAQALADGPPSGALYAPDAKTGAGVTMPRPSQPVAGFSAIVAGRRPGEYLAMPDNGFGSKANSADFLIRAYYIRPDFETAGGGSGEVEVRDFISFRDPRGHLGFPIVHGNTAERLLTGADIDPESLQRGKNGDYWIGDEFGPWILHFDRNGVLLDPPFPLPGGLMSPSNPHLPAGQPATQPGSRGIEAMALSPNGNHLYAVLEGATVTDTDQRRRLVFEFSVHDEAFTGRTWQYRTEQPAYMVGDAWALDQHRLVVIERDAGLGLGAVFRNVYVVDLRKVENTGFLAKRLSVDLTRIPDPNLISLPAMAGDVGLGDPFRVTCESIEVVHALSGSRLLVGCDNNLPNKGRNTVLADDTELIVIKVPGLAS